jgi:hypothetical protein
MGIADGLRRLANRLTGRDAPTEDERLLELFRNRAELKKELREIDDERHRLLDRLKLQEGATMRVEEQIAALEQYLGRPEAGYKCLAYYQLRAVWRTASRRIEQFSAELARQQKDRERRDQLVEFERAKAARLAGADRDLVEAGVLAGQLREEQRRAEQRLASLTGIWHHFRRRALRAEIEGRRERIDAATTELTSLEERRLQAQSAPPPLFEGLSLEGRRAVNLAVIAYTDVLHERLAATGLADLARESTLRRVYEADYGAREECLSLMQRAARAVADLDRTEDDLAEVRARAERLRQSAAYRNDSDALPRTESLQSVGPVLLEDYYEVYKSLLR